MHMHKHHIWLASSQKSLPYAKIPGAEMWQCCRAFSLIFWSTNPQLTPNAMHSGVVTTGISKAAQLERDRLSVKNNKLARALLLMLEHECTNRGKNGATKWTGKISIEHVLPRNMSKPGSDWRTTAAWTSQKQAEWLHRLGNLAMLNDSDNSSLGNCSFADKMQKVGRFLNSASWIVRDLYDTYKDSPWTEQQLQHRHQRMLALFCQRWGVNGPTPARASKGMSPARSVFSHLPRCGFIRAASPLPFLLHAMTYGHRTDFQMHSTYSSHFCLSNLSSTMKGLSTNPSDICARPGDRYHHQFLQVLV